MAEFGKYLNVLSYGKEDLTKEVDFQSIYPRYQVDIYFSLFLDTIMDANRMNLYWEIPVKSHYGYYLNKVRSRKRFSKNWPKRKKDDLVETIQEYYGYSVEKARQALEILSESQIEQIIIRTKKGGTK